MKKGAVGKKQEIFFPPIAVFHDLPCVDVGRLRQCWQLSPNPPGLAPTSRRRLAPSASEWLDVGARGRQMFFRLDSRHRTGGTSTATGGTFGNGFIFSFHRWKGTMTQSKMGPLQRLRGQCLQSQELQKKETSACVRDACTYMESRTWVERAGEWCAKTEASCFGHR